MAIQLIKQRVKSDCVICCIAMLTGITYETVLQAGVECGSYDLENGTRNESSILKALGYSNEYKAGVLVGNFNTLHRPYGIDAEFFRKSVSWGRRTMMCVPSLNITNGWHAVVSDGDSVFDPSNDNVYTDWSQLRPEYITVFREGSLK